MTVVELDSQKMEIQSYAESSQTQENTDSSQVLMASGEKTIAKPVEVPNVCGMTESLAKTMIKEAGLKVGRITEEPSDIVPVGCVISQGKEPGDIVSKGAKIKLVISLGAE